MVVGVSWVAVASLADVARREVGVAMRKLHHAMVPASGI